MNDEKRRFRIDINRLKQKIYNSYSPELKQKLIKAEKNKTLATLSESLDILESPDIKNICAMAQSQLKKDYISLAIYSLGFKLLCTLLFIFKSPVLLTLTTLAVVFFGYKIYKYIGYIRLGISSLKMYKVQKQTLEDTIKKLRSE